MLLAFQKEIFRETWLDTMSSWVGSSLCARLVCAKQTSSQNCNLLANLHCPGVAAEALAQFDRNDLASHHPMSIKVLGPSSATRPHIERMRDTNSCYLHPEVEEWLVVQNPAHIAICVPSDFPHPGQGARALAPSCTASLGFKLSKRKPSWSQTPWLKFCDLSSWGMLLPVAPQVEEADR